LVAINAKSIFMVKIEHHHGLYYHKQPLMTVL